MDSKVIRFIPEQIRSGGDRNVGYLLADRDAKQGVLEWISLRRLLDAIPNEASRGPAPVRG